MTQCEAKVVLGRLEKIDTRENDYDFIHCKRYTVGEPISLKIPHPHLFYTFLHPTAHYKLHAPTLHANIKQLSSKFFAFLNKLILILLY